MHLLWRRPWWSVVAPSGASLIAVVAIVWNGDTAVDRAWTGFVAELPDWLTWLAHAANPVSFASAIALLVGLALPRAILELIAAGVSRREAAEHLYLSVNTVKTYLRSVYRKLSASNRDDAVERARPLGMLDQTRSTDRAAPPNR